MKSLLEGWGLAGIAMMYFAIVIFGASAAFGIYCVVFALLHGWRP